jgi:hypothetical protein
LYRPFFYFCCYLPVPMATAIPSFRRTLPIRPDWEIQRVTPVHASSPTSTAEPSAPAERTLFQDEETGSTWDLTGLAIDGPLAASGIVFQGGESFGNTGGLFNNNMVVYDRTSRSLWSQMGLAAIRGDLGGSKRTTLPVFQGTWRAWKQLFPQTTILSAETGYSRNYANDIYIRSGYTTSREIWFPQEPSIDFRSLAQDHDAWPCARERHPCLSV